MSELINASVVRKAFRRQLLASASAFALAATLATRSVLASDQDSDRPTIWIELGGQLENTDTSEAQFAPPFLFATPRPAPETVSPLGVEGPPSRSNGAEGKITFQPENSNWIFSAAVRYGRSNANKHLHQQSYATQPLIPATSRGIAAQYQQVFQFIDAEKTSSETHAVLDFQAGKDVGLGMFGASSSSVFSFGVRFAQFGSKTNVAFKSDPDAHPTFKYISDNRRLLVGAIYHSNQAVAATIRSFRGVGPSLSWNASAPVLGNPQAGQIALDWGVNAAVLFGRQKAKVHHQTTALYHHGKYPEAYQYPANFRTTLYRHTPPDQTRSRFATVPNIGGFVGASFRIENFKVNLGYRADFFFGAMDGGVDAAKKENVGFYGPFASVSVGLGG